MWKLTAEHPFPENKTFDESIVNSGCTILSLLK